MPPIEWKLAEVIQSHGLTPLQVEREAQRLGYKFGTNTIYRLVRGDGPRLVDRETLAAVVDALCVLTGETITTDDVMPFAKPKPAARTRQAPEPSAPPSPGSPDVPTWARPVPDHDGDSAPIPGIWHGVGTTDTQGR